MANYNDLLVAIKQACKEQIEALKPATICYGTVTNTSPLTVQIDQKYELDKDNLIITETIANKLNQNDKVVLIMKQGGQEFLIIDRVV